MQQSLSLRLARNESCRVWQEQPIPVALVITDLDAGGAERGAGLLGAALKPAAVEASSFLP